MIITWLAGGLGNQMFQYAFGRAQSIAARRRLRLDLSFFRGSRERRYELGDLQVRARPLGSLGQALVDRFTAPRYERWKRLFPITELRESSFHGALPTSARPLYLRGYWQGEAFFRTAAAEIRAEFVSRTAPGPEAQELSLQIDAAQSVSVHVRRGDYVTNPLYREIHGPLALDYYESAVHAIEQRIPRPAFFVFSDDIDWVRANAAFPPNTVYWDRGHSAVEDLVLMSRCQHHIIANSTFSWWAAWLDASPAKVVVAPRRWYAQADREPPDLIPSTWIRL